MSKWKEVRLGDIVSIKSGYAYKGCYLGRGENYLLGMGCVSFKEKFLESGARAYEEDCDDRYCAFPGDIVLATRQQSENLPILAMPAIIPDAYAGKKMIVGTNLYLVKNHSDIDNRYLFWLLKSPNYVNYIASVKTGTTVRMVTKKNVEDYVFSCPSAEKRRRISSILWGLDAKIETNNRINAKLEEMAQALFKSWLATCDQKVTIGNISENITDYTKCISEEVVLINSSDVTDGYFEHHNLTENKDLKGHFKKRFKKGDILYSQVRPRNRHFGYCHFVPDNYLASTQLMVIRNNPKMVSDVLLYYYLTYDKVWQEFTNMTETRSGTFPQGNYEELSQIVVPYCINTIGIQSQLAALRTKMCAIYEESRRLAELRDALLPKLMNGEIEV